MKWGYYTLDRSEEIRALHRHRDPRFGRKHYRDADKSLARPTSRCILFVGENISFDASLVIYVIVLIFLQL